MVKAAVRLSRSQRVARVDLVAFRPGHSRTCSRRSRAG